MAVELPTYYEDNHCGVHCEQYLGEVGGNQSHADSKVSLVEVIGDIPAQLPILAPFLHYSMEQSKHPY